ncbi:dynein axonemal intermediate chain 2-like [Parasteatoda tepidariorum]|uniref:dynein axonemal intermediate chain 2-like n=1 Tax=Parasteatoda tepidariorum TaxID=114398 RepID=UPI0039BD90E4
MVQPNLSMPLIQSTNPDVCYNMTCLEYDSTLPNRLMVGAEEGTVLSCNRKYKDPKEIITGSYPSRYGPVIDISRNVFFPKLFASCSCYGVEVWSEDLTESPMINLKSPKGYVTDAIWSQNHPSFLLVTKSTGHLELWDILIKHHCPVLSVKFETEGLIRLNHKQHSNEVACSTPNGCILLIEVPEFTAFSLKQEKNLMAAMIDREGKRERTIEGITREINAREKHPEQKVDLDNSNLLGSSEEEEEDRFPEEFMSHFNSDFPEEDVEDENEETLFDLHFVDNLKKVSEAC